MNISIVIPTLNEEKGIQKTLRDISFFLLKNEKLKKEIIVVDGGSEDKTVKKAQEAGARVIFAKKGYGRQYKAGFKEVVGDIIITMDGDGTYPVEESIKLLEILEKEKLDFISLNRFSRSGKESINKINIIGNIFLTFFTNILFGLQLKDSQSGMWVFRKDILPELNLTSDGMPFSEEIKIEAFQKFKSKEIIGSYYKRVGEKSKLKLSDGFKNLFFLFKKRYNLLKKRR